jgi:membrane protein
MLNWRRVPTAWPGEHGAPTRPLEESRRLGQRFRELSAAVLDGFKRHDLLTYSSAICFQILTAVIPFLLFALAVAGLLHQSDIWRDHLEPQLRTHVAPAVFRVISNAVGQVFGGRKVLWASFGGLLTLWQVSGAVRAVMGALARIYGAPGERPFLRRHSVSFLLAMEVGLCFIAAGACLLLAPFHSVAHPDITWNVFSFIVRWTLVVAMLGLAVGLLVRHAPGQVQTVPWVSLGVAIVIATWVVVSVVFYLYLTEVASYESVFGNLAAVIVALGYLYLSTTVFLFGAQLDAILRAQTTGRLHGEHPGREAPEQLAAA